MIHPDDDNEAMDFISRESVRNVAAGMGHEEAIDAACNKWRGSLERAQGINRWVKDQIAHGKPTLRVPMFELARIK